MSPRRRIAILAMVFSHSGCGAGGDDPVQSASVESKAPPPPVSTWTYVACESQHPATVPSAPETDAVPGGIWRGTLTNELLRAAEAYTAIVADDGRFRLQSSGHTQWVGTLTTQANTFTGDGFAHSGGVLWNDGTLVSELSVAGMINERDSLAGTWAMASGDAGCFDFSFDADLYERPSSLDLLAGMWISYDDWGFLWLSLTVDADGSFTGLDIYGCDLTGRFVLIDDRYNLYEVQSTFTQTAGDAYRCDTAGNYTGLAYLYDLNQESATNDLLYVSLAGDTEALDLHIHH